MLNLHQLLRLERPLVIFDVETTGLKFDEARIWELGFRVYTTEGEKSHWRSLINTGSPLPPHTIENYKVSDELMLNCRLCGLPESEHGFHQAGEFASGSNCIEFKPVPRFEQIALHLSQGFSGCDFAGKNVRFDLKMMAAEFKRAGVVWSYANARVIDADRLEQIGEPRSLSHLYKKHTGKDLPNAHQALVDVDATIEVIEAQLQKYIVLPRGIKELHELQWPGWIDTEGKFRMVNGVPCITFGKHSGIPMQQVPSGYWKWITGGEFSPEIKELAGAALQGRFPTP